MSIEALAAVLNAPIPDPTRKLVVIGLANHAHRDGTNAWCSVPQLARYAGCSLRTVTRHLGTALGEGWIREGDQQQVAHLPANRRPTVYDVALSEATRQTWEIDKAQTPRRDAAARTGQMAHHGSRPDNLTGQKIGPWGDTGGHSDLTESTLRPDSGVRQTKDKPTTEPTTPAALRADGSAETDGQRVNRLAKVYTDVVKLSNFLAVMGVVRKACKADYDDDTITAGLQRLAEDNRPVTVDSLRIAMEGCTPAAATMTAHAQRVQGGLALAARLREQEQAAEQAAIGSGAR